MIISDILGLEPLLESLTVATLIVRLRRPRPFLRRVARQPGFAAGFVVLCFLIFQLPDAGASVVKRMIEEDLWLSGQGFLGEFLNYLIIQCFELDFYLGPTVAVVWALMALGRGLRREGGWIDGCGGYSGAPGLRS